MSDYYTYRQIPVTLRGEPAVMVGKPGVWSWNEVNPGTAALIDVMEIEPADRVLDLGCGTGLIGLAAARLVTTGRVTLVDVNSAAVMCAQQTPAANGIANAEVWLADGTDAVGITMSCSVFPRRAVVGHSFKLWRWQSSLGGGLSGRWRAGVKRHCLRRPTLGGRR
jgi:SAM-dependent methyltransferase